MTGRGFEAHRHTQSADRSVPTTVTVGLDVPARLALAALIADGTPIAEAVREAIIAAGARWLDQPAPLGEDPPEETARRSEVGTPRATPSSGPCSGRKAARLTPEETAALKEWADRRVAEAPSPSACQIYVLREAFMEGRIVEACDARGGSGLQPSASPRRFECRAPDCLEDDYDER